MGNLLFLKGLMLLRMGGSVVAGSDLLLREGSIDAGCWEFIVARFVPLLSFTNSIQNT